MRSNRVWMAGVFALSFAAAVAADQPAPSMAPASPMMKGMVGENLVSVTAKVNSVDYENRLLTITGPDGYTDVLEVDEAVKNFKQIKAGDQIVAKYYESLAYEVFKAGEAPGGIQVTQGADAAKPGKKPAAVGARTVTVTTTITAIDPSKPSVTLKGPAGNSQTVKVKDPKKLEGVKVGDQVQITYTEALAVSVEKAPKK